MWLNDDNAFGSCRTVYCGVLNREVLDYVYQNLRAGALKMTSFQSTKICGTINAEAGKSVLFTSIPYDAGWHVYVDGMESESFSVMDGAFLAAAVPAGEHNIEILYRDDALVAGGLCSACGAVLWGLLCWKERRRKQQG